MANNTNYLVARCQQCEALNVLHKSRIEEAREVGHEGKDI